MIHAYRSLLGETLASFRRVGVFRTILIGVSRIVDILFDLYYGVETAKRIHLDQLSIEFDTACQGSPYQPTGVVNFKRVMQKVWFPPPGVFVDYGSGKGQALLLASLEPFARVVGIEFSEELCRIAHDNIARFRRKARNAAPVEIFHQDAARFEYRGDENVFYLIYPFDAALMAHVLERIEDSLRDRPRSAVLIYYYPIHREVLDSSQFFALEQAFAIFGNECLVYRYDGKASPFS